MNQATNDTKSAETILFRSTSVADMPPSQKLYAAISILQAHILASDSALNADKLFGVNHMQCPGLEVAESLLQDLVLAVQDPSEVPDPA